MSLRVLYCKFIQWWIRYDKQREARAVRRERKRDAVLYELEQHVRDIIQERSLLSASSESILKPLRE